MGWCAIAPISGTRVVAIRPQIQLMLLLLPLLLLLRPAADVLVSFVFVRASRLHELPSNGPLASQGTKEICLVPAATEEAHKISIHLAERDLASRPATCSSHQVAFPRTVGFSASSWVQKLSRTHRRLISGRKDLGGSVPGTARIMAFCEYRGSG